MTLLRDSEPGLEWSGSERASAEMCDGAHLSPPLPRIVPDARPTILTAGHAAGALAMWAERAGLRAVGSVAIAQLAERLARTALLDLVLLDLRGVDIVATLGSLQARTIAMRFGLGGTRLAVIADLDGLDAALALFDGPQVEFLCDPAESDIITLLAMTGLGQARDGHAWLSDSARESDTARLERLSEEVRRLAATIERLAGQGPMTDESASLMSPRGHYRTHEGDMMMAPFEGPAMRSRSRSAAAGARLEPITHADLRAIIRARRMRDQFLPADLFADPAWDMMLDLLAARLSGQRVSVSSLCIASAVPPTTALRWIRQLTDRAVFARIDDPADGRRVFIELTDDAAEAITAWAQAVRRNGGLLAPARH